MGALRLFKNPGMKPRERSQPGMKETRLLGADRHFFQEAKLIQAATGTHRHSRQGIFRQHHRQSGGLSQEDIEIAQHGATTNLRGTW